MVATDTDKAKIKAIGALFIPGAFPRQEQEGTERQLLQVYLIAVDGIPADFVGMAVKRFVQGQVERSNLQFRPTPPELAVEARRLRDRALVYEQASQARLPKPIEPEMPDPTPEERQRCAEMWRLARAEILAAAEAARPPRQTRFRSQLPPADAAPERDLSDFPAADASRAEIKAWEKRQEEAATIEGTAC